MKLIHQMNLKGPWNYRWDTPHLTETELGCPVQGKVQIPSSWVHCFGTCTGVVTWSRRFQRPTNLDTNERVMVASSNLAGLQEVRLNEQTLSSEDQSETGFRFDITAALLPSNVLELVMSCTSVEEIADRGMTEPAVIEIWSTID